MGRERKKRSLLGFNSMAVDVFLSFRISAGRHHHDLHVGYKVHERDHIPIPINALTAP